MRRRQRRRPPPESSDEVADQAELLLSQLTVVVNEMCALLKAKEHK